MNHKLESRLQGEISIISDMRMTPRLEQKAKRNERASLNVEEESEKPGLKRNTQKMKIMVAGAITSWQTDGKTMETVTDYIFWAPKPLQMVVTAAMKLRHLLLGRKAITNLDKIFKAEILLCQQRPV